MAQPSTSRRQLFGASAAMLLLGSAAAGSGKAAELDSDLLIACAAYHTAFARQEDPETPDGDELDDACLACNDALARVMDLQPRTPEGIQAKAAVAYSHLMWEVDASLKLHWREQATRGQAIALDVLQDFLGRAHA